MPARASGHAAGPLTLAASRDYLGSVGPEVTDEGRRDRRLVKPDEPAAGGGR
jgi:hypothetical protein